MESASKLSVAEVRLIKGMLEILPGLTKQAILAYFTRPGRDFNHRVIREIADGQRLPAEPPASSAETLAYMAAMEAIARPNADDFLHAGHTRFAMPSATRWLLLNWWPVGQGLFSSGSIIRRQAPPFTWTYDCGTTSSDTILQAALDEFGYLQNLIGSRRIRLAVLSHFDKDHISGFVRLVKSSLIDTIILPYIPLWQRLVIALEQGVGADDPNFEFFIDPAAFLFGIDGGQIGEIVFVPSAGPEDVPDSPEGPDIGPEDRGDDILKVEEGQPPSEAAGDPVTLSGTHTKVRFLRKAGRIVVPAFWEFVPYNDAQMAPKATPGFLAAATPLVATLRDDPAKRVSALAELKDLYIRTFGGSSKARNLISLFLYSGPLGRRHVLSAYGGAFAAGSERFCQMHTGDGTLDAGARFNAFRRFYTPANRLRRSGIFQVMHHGARGNWHKGLAKSIEPVISLFSSDPAHMGLNHPDAEVLRDFWPYGATQVDREKGFHFLGRLEHY